MVKCVRLYLIRKDQEIKGDHVITSFKMKKIVFISVVFISVIAINVFKGRQPEIIKVIETADFNESQGVVDISMHFDPFIKIGMSADELELLLVELKFYIYKKSNNEFYAHYRYLHDAGFYVSVEDFASKKYIVTAHVLSEDGFVSSFSFTREKLGFKD